MGRCLQCCIQYTLILQVGDGGGKSGEGEKKGGEPGGDTGRERIEIWEGSERGEWRGGSGEKVAWKERVFVIATSII